MKNTRQNKELFTQFFENPTRDLLSTILEHMDSETQEIEFKLNWEVENSKIAKEILGMANTSDGIIIFGVEEKNGELKSRGIEKKDIKDDADFRNAMEPYLPDELLKFIELVQFNLNPKTARTTSHYQVLFVRHKETHLPFVSKKNGDNIERNAIYYRNGTKVEKATYTQLQEILDKRVKSQSLNLSSLTLQEELKELNTLYDQLMTPLFQNLTKPFLQTKECYPEEGFDEFVLRMIDFKKEKIKKRLSK